MYQLISKIYKLKKLLVITKTVPIGLSLAVIMLFSACSKKMSFSNSSVVPAAVGSVKVKSDKNKNHTIDISISNLAPASRLSPPQNTYVVWMVTESNGTKNIGQLNSSSGFMSKSLSGSLKTVTSFQPTSFFITAEDDGDVQYPGTTLVLKTN